MLGASSAAAAGFLLHLCELGGRGEAAVLVRSLKASIRLAVPHRCVLLSSQIPSEQRLVPLLVIRRRERAQLGGQWGRRHVQVFVGALEVGAGYRLRLVFPEQARWRHRQQLTRALHVRIRERISHLRGVQVLLLVTEGVAATEPHLQRRELDLEVVASDLMTESSIIFLLRYAIITNISYPRILNRLPTVAIIRAVALLFFNSNRLLAVLANKLFEDV